MEDQFPKMETFMHKELAAHSSFHGMAAGSRCFGDPTIWGALAGAACHVDDGNNGKKSPSQSSPERLFSGSESSSSVDDLVSGTNLVGNIPGFSRQDYSKQNHESCFMSGLYSINSPGGSISDHIVKESSINPVNFSEYFPALNNQAQASEPPSPSSLSNTSKFPNLTLFLQEPEAFIQTSLQGSKPKQAVDQHGKDQRYLKHQLKANSLNGTTAALLEAKLQLAISQGNNISVQKKHSDDPPPTSPDKIIHDMNATKPKGLSQNTTREELQFELEGRTTGCHEVIRENQKGHEVVASDIEAVQLSRMPSLDMDMIWDSLLVSDS
uniref:Ethylene-responsive transcription factor ERF062-like n=1 Tax=Populus alba TaxID=43335 RepID=A0A4U5QDB1_POPAL|nr:ethylene-responsive transcription factor ERF062-like [Populus alba]